MTYRQLIQQQAEQVFGNKTKADGWLNQPKAVFAGATPMGLTDSEAGYLSVKDELERISQGYAS